MEQLQQEKSEKARLAEKQEIARKMLADGFRFCYSDWLGTGVVQWDWF
ncbi:hypothetical protein BGP_0410 [Beggiatoa sp. PS]|nr:hypothetical protein BGP_0410 [Beggiatoa sp. PS]